jgi:acetyl/propionyl-CoA carboxylase alpha subunit
LRHYPVLGIRTNIPFLIRVLSHEAFRAGEVHTGFIEQHLEELIAPSQPPAAAVAAAAIAPAASARLAGGEGQGDVADRDARSNDPWTMIQGWGR